MRKREGTALRPAAEPGTNSRIIASALTSWNLAKVDTKNPEAVKERVLEYLSYCQESDVPPSVAGCASWLGVHITTLENWYTGRVNLPEHQKIMTMFYSIMQTIWAQDMHEGNINPVAGIFMGKVFYGYKDTQEIVVKNDAAETAMTSEDLIAESKMLPGAEKLLSDDRRKPIDVEAKIIDAEVKPAEKAKKKPGTKKRKKGGPPLCYPETRNMTQKERTRYNQKRKEQEQKEQFLADAASLEDLMQYEAQKERRKAQKAAERPEN